MQLQEQGLRRCPTSADQHQRMVCFTIFTILMILPTFPIDGWGLYQFHIDKHRRSMFILFFRFWSDGNKRIPPTNIPSKLTFWSRTGVARQRQPDNYEGVKAGKLDNVNDPSGLTVEGLQEFYDEACLAVLNNKYRDGIQWH